MKSIADEESKKYQSHFSEYIKKNIAGDDMEALYKKVHATIRAYPTMAKSTKEPPKTHKS
uniref:Large ribosomal subunit protein uL18 C-terminal eukaryotes domain-containing protein n=2 Tax=Aegilops tauschii TaxID=37682 RepID=A0A453M0H8_AEGTS